MPSKGCEGEPRRRLTVLHHALKSASAPDLIELCRWDDSESDDHRCHSGPQQGGLQTSQQPLDTLGIATPKRTPPPTPASPRDNPSGHAISLDHPADDSDAMALELSDRSRGIGIPVSLGSHTPFTGQQASELCNGPSSPLPDSDIEPEETHATNPRVSRQTPLAYTSPSFGASRQDSVEPSSPACNMRRQTLSHLSFSLWDYLYREVVATDELDGASSADLRVERVSNFLSVPVAVERIVLFGFAICFDAFLYTFTVLPLRVIVALIRLAAGLHDRLWFSWRKGGPPANRRLRVSHKVDLVKGMVLLLSCATLHHITDTSQMYHSVRGQDTIKLYVIYNVLEIADRLCCSFGQDVLDSLFSRATLARRTDGSQPRLRPAVLFLLAYVFTVAHTLVLVYQLVTLNVAINSYDNALLTLLLSNQFVEIKGSVFKKFEKENLFQMTCADIVERFQLSLLLGIISLRNLIELSGSTFSHLPTSFDLFPSLSLIQTVFTPAATVLASEVGTDWLKHAFINKFNHIRPAVYGRFIDVLCKDLITDHSTDITAQPFVDQSPMVSRRLGFAVLPFSCLVVRVVSQAMDMLSDDSHIDECSPPLGRSPVRRGGLVPLFPQENLTAVATKWGFVALVLLTAWSCLIALKLLLGINLRSYAADRYASMSQRVQEDALNAKGRLPIGADGTELALNTAVSAMLNREELDAKSKPKETIRMEDLDRFTMTRSRIW